ncbi:hypothetical protein QFC21_004551 [Naganishia friedmannii]|uniref:Uncharacterized protein n=1 Tax=Naganishia friedmannii TaxID=89922 RepID=A0ACC2VI37_9TREE|nr:hypothetical protein QFC21_004551 [Naganishia friedmannii]
MSSNQDMSDADKIRAKRIAAMQRSMAQAQQESAAAAQPSSSSSSTPHQQQPQPQQRSESALNRLVGSSSPAPASAATATATVNPAAILASTPTTSVRASSSSSAVPSVAGPLIRNYTITPAKPAPAAAVAGAAGAKKLEYEEWEADKVGQVLGVYLTEQEAARAAPHTRIHLQALAQELGESFPPSDVRTNMQHLDALLIARLSLPPHAIPGAGPETTTTTFEYLTGCWTRLYAAQREFVSVSAAQGWSRDGEGARWTRAYARIKELVMSYLGYTLEDPGMFPQPEGRAAGPAEFLPILLSATCSAQGYDPLTSSTPSTRTTANLALQPDALPQFLTDLAARFTITDAADDDPDSLHRILESVLSFLFQEFFKAAPPVDLVGGEWRRWVGAVEVLVQVKAIAALCRAGADRVVFPVGTVDAAECVSSRMGKSCGGGGGGGLLKWGRLADLGSTFLIQPNVWKTYFANPDERSKGDIEANQEGLRASLVQLQDELFKVYNAIIRASPEARDHLLDFIGTVVNRNVKRSGMRVDPKTVASDGFMVNLQAILLRLFEPVLDVTYSKLDRVDSGYYTRSKTRVDVTEETKIKATRTEYDEYRAEVEAGGSGSSSATTTTSPFISDLFFLLNAYQHVGMNKTISNRDRASKNIHEIRKDLRRLEAERASWGPGTPQALQGEAAIQRFKSDIDVLRSSVAAYDTQLLSKEFIQRNVQFLCFSMTWLIRLVDPAHRFPVTMIKLPLPAEAPVQFKMLPEYLIENVAEYLEFIVRWADPNTLEKQDKDTIVTFILTFLSPNYVNNPFLKAKFMGILAAGVQPTGYFRRGILYETLIYHPLASHYLMPTLVRFFIDVEITGASTQFYDKFNIRRDIDMIFKAMWDNPIQREAFAQARRDDFELFIRFVNMLMSDTTYHLDESLSKLAAIHNVQQAMANQDEWNARPESERKDLESQLQQAESSAPFHTHSGRSHIQLIREFTATTKEPFLTPEIVDRLAATFDENLVTLVGPKMQDLKVAEPEKFAFKPKDLLADIAQIYINLGESPEFIRAVANDGRSYSKATFEKLARILKNRAILIDHEIESLLTFIAKVEDAKATIEIEDEREIPDEFLDPLMATLMKDPVILPVSKVTIDRSTIRAALLQKPLDPFSNQPLKLEDCIPNVELKQQIDEWLKDGQSQGMKGSLAEPTPMDVDEL